MIDDEQKTVVVIDNGSNTIKAGFAGDDAPRKIFPSYVGYTKRSPINLAMDEKSYYVGDEANHLLIQSQKIGKMLKIYGHILYTMFLKYVQINVFQ